jgi:hypothetical protein
MSPRQQFDLEAPLSATASRRVTPMLIMCGNCSCRQHLRPSGATDDTHALNLLEAMTGFHTTIFPPLAGDASRTISVDTTVRPS